MIFQVPLFASLHRADLPGLAREFREQQYRPGQLLTREGAKSTHFVLIYAGRANVCRADKAPGF